jgi:hypothetical protein
MTKSTEIRLRAYKALAQAEQTLADLKKDRVSKRNKENATVAGSKVNLVHVALAKIELVEKGIKPTQANIAAKVGVDIKTLRKIIKEK